MPGQLPRKFFIVAFVPNANRPHNHGAEQWEARRRRVRLAHQQGHAALVLDRNPHNGPPDCAPGYAEVPRRGCAKTRRPDKVDRPSSLRLRNGEHQPISRLRFEKDFHLKPILKRRGSTSEVAFHDAPI
jgi:hypothetical protein